MPWIEVSQFKNLFEPHPVIAYYNINYLSCYTNPLILENADRN